MLLQLQQIICAAPEACLPALLCLGLLKQDDSIEDIFCHAVHTSMVEMGVKKLLCQKAGPCHIGLRTPRLDSDMIFFPRHY